MEISKRHRVLALTHERLQDALVLPRKLTPRGGWMQEQLKRTLMKAKGKTSNKTHQYTMFSLILTNILISAHLMVMMVQQPEALD